MTYTLITGASFGIGYELAHVFAEKKHNVILTARSEEKLQALKKELEEKHQIKAHVIVADLAKSESPQTLFQVIKTQNWEVDTLINNAGFGDHGDFYKSDWKKQRDMIQVNITTLTELTHLFLPGMVQKKYGRILNVASIAAFQPGPFMSVYYATKAFVLSFSEALYEELQGTGVTVTALCPGPTRSEFFDRANVKGVALVEALPMPTCRTVAEYAYKALRQKKPVAVHGSVNKILASSNRFVTRNLARKLVRRIQS